MELAITAALTWIAAGSKAGTWHSLLSLCENQSGSDALPAKTAKVLVTACNLLQQADPGKNEHASPEASTLAGRESLLVPLHTESEVGEKGR